MGKHWNAGVDTAPLLFDSKDGLTVRNVGNGRFLISSDIVPGEAVAELDIDDGLARVVSGDALLFPGRRLKKGPIGVGTLVVEDLPFNLVLATGRSARISFRPYDTTTIGLVENMLMRLFSFKTVAVAVTIPLLLGIIAYTSAYYSGDIASSSAVQTVIEGLVQKGLKP